MPRTYAAEDSAVIRKNMLRNRLLRLIADAALPDGAVVSRDMMLAAGYTAEEFQALPQSEHTVPIKDTALR